MNDAESSRTFRYLEKQHQGKRRQRALEKAQPKQWALLDIAIGAFAKEYPLEWNVFKVDQARLQNGEKSFNVAREGGLKKSNFRSVASFPVIFREGRMVDGLLPVLEKIIPGLTSSKSRNFVTFLRKYPIFKTSAKIGASE